MKKILVISLLGILSLNSMGGSIAWGSYAPNGLSYVTFKDNTGNNFQGYAYLFLLNGNNEVSWNGTSWNLNGATQLAWDDGSPTSGRWYDAAEVVPDNQMSPTFNYQAILATTPLNPLLTSVNSGYWAATAVIQLANYTEIDGLNKNGLLAWQTTSTSWAPVAAVPEPATMALFGLGGLALVIRRKMRKEA